MENHLINPIYRVDVAALSGPIETELFFDPEAAAAYIKEWREDLENNVDSIPVGGISIRITLEDVLSYQVVE
jgi:hypothetical protein